MLIPKLFHVVWLGPDPMPDRHAAFLEGWRKVHPEWEWRTWSEDNLPPLRLRRQFDAARSWAGKADIVRYEVIATHGGVYLDTDMECLKNIEDLLHACRAFVCRSAPSGRVGNAIFGATPDHPFVRRVIAAVPARHDPRRPTLTGPRLLTELAGQTGDVRVFEQALFFPVPTKSEPRSKLGGPRGSPIHTACIGSRLHG